MNLFNEQEKSCARCGKTFIVYGNEWGYKSGNKLYCSWRCLRAKETEKVPRMNQDIREGITQAIKDGLTTREITALLGCNAEQVYYLRRKVEKDG